MFQEVIDAVKGHGPVAVVEDKIANVGPIEELPETVTEIRKLGC